MTHDAAVALRRSWMPRPWITVGSIVAVLLAAAALAVATAASSALEVADLASRVRALNGSSAARALQLDGIAPVMRKAIVAAGRPLIYAAPNRPSGIR